MCHKWLQTSRKSKIWKSKEKEGKEKREKIDLNL